MAPLDDRAYVHEESLDHESDVQTIVVTLSRYAG